MIPLTDEDYWVAEPCFGCEYVYVEDIWLEWCCDAKKCKYKKKSEVENEVK